MRARPEPGDKGKAGAEEGDGLLSALEERMRQIARETFRAMSGGADVGVVKVKTATKLLDMSEFRVRQLIREGKLRVVRPTPNTIRIPLTEIRRFQEGEK
jgi:crotonobetainyl-CoA:carnitine CoA-transferase CaiB-like acyl-CoA transferase